MTNAAYIIGAKRTPVAPKNGAFAAISAPRLGQFVIEDLLGEIGLPGEAVEQCIFGNALYAGGNPARLSALAAGLPESTPAMTIDTQCCGGLDSLHLACSLITAGRYDVILAGGIESYSTAPRRLKRAQGNAPDIEYKRPPFSPWSDRDPDMLDAAAMLAKEHSITRLAQEAYARKSHSKAIAAKARLTSECVSVSSIQTDSFARNLHDRAQSKLRVLAGDPDFGVTASTTAVEADASAICAVASESFLLSNPTFRPNAVRILGGVSVGGDPAMPGIAPVAAIKSTLSELSLNIVQFSAIEVMEAFACQAIACIKLCGMNQDKVNLGGGALARGHPIGASGAINAVRLYHELISNSERKLGLATIAGAGGLGSTLVLER